MSDEPKKPNMLVLCIAFAAWFAAMFAAFGFGLDLLMVIAAPLYVLVETAIKNMEAR